ncbi:MAG: hypothetical protein ACI4S2_00620 [Lachnospiraceae bacterium]
MSRRKAAKTAKKGLFKVIFSRTGIFLILILIRVFDTCILEIL